MSVSRMTLAMLLLAAVAGCDEDSEEEPKTAGYEACVDYIEVVCDKTTSCAVELGEVHAAGQASTYKDCVAQTRKVISCENVTGTSGSYDACLSAFQSLSCTPFFYDTAAGNTTSIPASCRGALIFQ